MEKKYPVKYNEITKGKGGQVRFLKLCEAADCANANEVAQYRNYALHNKMLLFSKCPEPLQSFYQDIVKKQDSRQNDDKNKIHNKHR